MRRAAMSFDQHVHAAVGESRRLTSCLLAQLSFDIMRSPKYSASPALMQLKQRRPLRYFLNEKMDLVACIWCLWLDSLFTKSRPGPLRIGIRVNMFVLAMSFLSLGVVGIRATGEGHTGYIRERLVGDTWCDVPAQTLPGSVCGRLRSSYLGRPYASFRGLPYAKQPLGELRFAAPQPVESWDGFFDASVEGPVCPQRDVLYGPMMRPRSVGEDCLHANVHVPAAALPAWGEECCGGACLPVIVFLHGGAFQSGSGDSDLNAPDYIMDKEVVVITLNYRLGPFGFLCLNSPSVPGNAGLRDMMTALQWVQDNIRAFGGDPARVTLMGQSSGASDAHILSLSKAAVGLFQNVILMSGTASSGFFSTLPSYAQYINNAFLKQLGINSTDPDEAQRQLIALPYQALVDANSVLLETAGFTVFCPVVESQFDGVTRILDGDPELLVAKGRGRQYPMLLGFSNNECASLRHRLEEVDIVAKIKKNANVILPARLLFADTPEKQAADAKQMMERYIQGTPTVEKYIPSCSDSLFVYPALKLAEARLRTGGAPLYLYQFSYSSSSVPIKLAYGTQYPGAGHTDDLTYVLRVNSMLQGIRLSNRDESIKNWMVDIVENFAVCNNATCSGQKDPLWPGVSRKTGLQYQDIQGPWWAMAPLTRQQRATIRFFDKLYGVQ